MVTRREVMTTGVLGTLAGTTPEASASSTQDDAATARVLGQLNSQLSTINGTLNSGLVGPGLASGFLADIRTRFTTHLRAAGKFPDFMEIGVEPFYDVYDWHVRHNQQITITRVAEQRFAIQWMFTQLILRYEQDPRYLGIPFDRSV